jgi:hypothetical protein
VQVDRGVECFGCFQDGPELLVVQVLAVGVRVDDHTLEAEARAAFDLLGRRGRVLRCDGGQAGEAVRMAPAGFREPVVGQRGHGHRPVGGEHLRAGCGQGDDLPVDARGVHVGEAVLAEVLEAFGDGPGPLAAVPGVEADQADESRIQVGSGVEHVPPQRHQLGWREGFLGRDVQIVHVRITSSCSRRRNGRSACVAVS